MNDKELLLVEQIVKEALADLDLQEGVKIKKLAGDLAAVLLPVLITYGVAPEKFEFVTDYVSDIIGDHFAEEELEKLTPYTGEEKPSTPADEQDLESDDIIRALIDKGVVAEQVYNVVSEANNIGNILSFIKGRNIQSVEDVDTIGDLKALIQAAQLKKQGGQAAEEIKSTLMNAVVDEIVGKVPGLAMAKGLFDAAKSAYSLPDEASEGTALKYLDVDDDVAKIVDDPIENAFLAQYLKDLEDEDDETLLRDFNVTKELQKYIHNAFNKNTVGPVDLTEATITGSQLKSKLKPLYPNLAKVSDNEMGSFNDLINKIIAYLTAKNAPVIDKDSILKRVEAALTSAAPEATPEEPPAESIEEARKSTKGYIYEVTARMVTSRDRNKSEIINDLRAIKYVTVVSIVPGQNFALQKTPTKEKTLVKIKFHPKGSPLKTVQKIKASAFGRSLDTDCPNIKISGLIELDIKRDTLTPVRTY